MSKKIKAGLAASAVLGILICMVVMQWQGPSGDDDSAGGDDDSAHADDDSGAQ